MSTEELWDSTLRLRSEMLQLEEIPERMVIGKNDIVIGEGKSRVDSPILIGRSASRSHYFISEGDHLERGELSLPPEVASFYTLYLPFALAPVFARKRKYAVAVAHFAQSLDGKIATRSGHSQWIGNEANLQHAHRMRALCDGVLIGSRTLIRDKPRLTVRRVSGRNPAKIVLGSGDYDMDSLRSDDCRIIQITGNGRSENSDIQVISLGSNDRDIPSGEILASLFEHGIHSVYVEGGNITSSRFLQDKALDYVQLHIAPMVLGSGINSFSLPEKEKIGEGIGFSHFDYFRMDDEIMFQGRPEYR